MKLRLGCRRSDTGRIKALGNLFRQKPLCALAFWSEDMDAVGKENVASDGCLWRERRYEERGPQLPLFCYPSDPVPQVL
eukprot:3658271-Rhodomonas_salina.1